MLAWEITYLIRNQAQQLIKLGKLIKNDDLYHYNHFDGSVGTISTKKEHCTCRKFFDKAVCYHLTATCIIDMWL